jgi:4-nitrophenyl phosphatase
MTFIDEQTIKIMIDAVIFDLDGTLYVGRTPVPGAPEKVEELRRQGKKILFLTNAATRSRESVAHKLRGMGFRAEKGEIYCSAYVLARYVAENHPGKKVFVVGEEGIAEELHGLGIKTVESKADIVAAGLDRSFTYEKLSKALAELERGAVFLASNMDATYPTESGPMPGAGAIVAAIGFASGKKAHVVGKPNPYVLELIKSEQGLSNERIMIVGDRIETDIKFARDCRIKSALVLSGSSKKSDIKEVKPDRIFRSVAEFSLP